ncbi:MAG: hypothetical protein FWB83_07355 [Treponema sp.]|nr:hypothetical protein [Treponema sp.]
MGQVLKKDFDGQDFQKLMEECPDKADYFTSILTEIERSDLEPQQSQLKTGGNSPLYRLASLEAAVEKGCKGAFETLCLFYRRAFAGRKDNQYVLNIKRFANFMNKKYPMNETDINFNKDECDALADRILELAEYAAQEGIWSIKAFIKKDDNHVLKTVFSMAANGIHSDLIRELLIYNLKFDDNTAVTNSDYNLTGKRLILNGIEYIIREENIYRTKLKLYDILGKDISCMEEEWKNEKEYSNYETASIYYERGCIYSARKNWDAAIDDFQEACTLAEREDEDIIKYLRSKLRYACGEKQIGQTLEERMAPYAELIKKIKNEPAQPIYKIVKCETREEIAEFAAAFALFEEYELLDRYIKEAGGGKYTVFSFNVLNYNVSPQFAYWEPTPLYFITSRKAWNSMKDPKRMLTHLAKKYSDVNAAAGDGTTALWNQTYHDSSLEILNALLELYANPNKLSFDSDCHWPPLVHALMMKYSQEDDENHPFDDDAVKRAKLLLEYGADPNLASPELLNYPPLVIAIKFGFVTDDGPEGGKAADGVLELIELLIEKGANINFLDSDGNTPLSIAQKNDLSDVEEILLKHNALLPDELIEPDDDGRHDAWC